MITAAVNTNVKLKQLKVCAPMRPLYLKLQIEINRKHTHTLSYTHTRTHARKAVSVKNMNGKQFLVKSKTENTLTLLDFH